MEVDLMRIGFAAILGIILGLERELKRKPLGLRTTLVISVASCLITIVSFHSAANYSRIFHFDADPTRIAAAIVSGVGFLGAGVILRRSNEMIVNLTTSAVIWAASGLGIAAGTGFYVEALAALIIIILSIELVPVIMRKVGPNPLREKELQMLFTVNSMVDLEDVMEKISSLNIKIEHAKFKVEGDQSKINLLCVVDIQKQVFELFKDIRLIEEISDLEIEFL